MSQQQFSYFDPEQETVYKPRNINGDPSESQGDQEEQEQAVHYVTPEQSMLKGEKLIPRHRTKSHSNWMGAILFLLMILVAGLVWGAQGHSVPGIKVLPQPPSYTRTFYTPDQPKVVINNMGETVHVTVGDSHTVVVSESNRDGSYGPHDFGVNPESVQTGNEVDVTGYQPKRHFGFDHSGELDVTVPSLADVAINNDVGDITIEDLSGQVQATTGSGDIQVQRANLSGSSILHTDRGNITFGGKLDPQGAYSMTTNDGSVDITLPTNAAFNLHTNSDADHVNNEFPNGNVGSDLTVSAGNGSINIHKADS